MSAEIESPRTWKIKPIEPDLDWALWRALRECSKQFSPIGRVEEPLFGLTQPPRETLELYAGLLRETDEGPVFAARVQELAEAWARSENAALDPSTLAGAFKFQHDWVLPLTAVDLRINQPLAKMPKSTKELFELDNQPLREWSKHVVTKRYGKGVATRAEIVALQQKQLISYMYSRYYEAFGQLMPQMNLDYLRQKEKGTLGQLPEYLTVEYVERNLHTRKGTVLLNRFLGEEDLQELANMFEPETWEYMLNSAKAISAFFDFCASFDLQRDPNKLPDGEEIKSFEELRQRWFDRTCWLATFGGIPLDDIARMMRFEQSVLGLSDVVQSFHHRQIDTLLPGLNAESLTAVYYLERGFSVRASTGEEDQAQVDLVVEKDGMVSFIQVKGDRDVTRFNTIDLRKQRNISPKIMKKKDVQLFREHANANGAEAFLVRAPSSVTRYCQQHNLPLITVD